jgi:hypothetical protein
VSSLSQRRQFPHLVDCAELDPAERPHHELLHLGGGLEPAVRADRLGVILLLAVGRDAWSRLRTT